MTGVLASVRSVEEAALVLAAGADFIDLKEPSAGALGALAPETIRAVVAHVAGRRSVSATIGDLPMDPSVVRTAIGRTAACGVDIVKVGLFPGGDQDGCLLAMSEAAASGCRIVAVMFADLAPDFGLIDRARELALTGVMLDTAGKQGGGLRCHLASAELAEFVSRSRASGLLCGLAGSLSIADIPPLVALQPDYLGFRGALCRDGRTGELDPKKVRDVCAAVRKASRSQSPATSAATAAAGAQRAAHSRIPASPEIRVAKSM